MKIIALVTCLTALGQAHPYPIEFGVSAAADHRHALPGKLQVDHWIVRNLGTRPLDQVRLDVRPPADWAVRDAGGCDTGGPGLRCRLGRLAPGDHATVVIQMMVPAHPRLGRVRIPGTVSAAGGVIGPSAALDVIVVRHL